MDHEDNCTWPREVSLLLKVEIYSAPLDATTLAYQAVDMCI